MSYVSRNRLMHAEAGLRLLPSTWIATMPSKGFPPALPEISGTHVEERYGKGIELHSMVRSLGGLSCICILRYRIRNRIMKVCRRVIGPLIVTAFLPATVSSRSMAVL